jgi:glycosyltransferase involved in cell wall biosynthesis
MTENRRNRIAWTGPWSRKHNNPRYEELLPRLTNVDRHPIDMHPWWPLRGVRRRIGLPLLAVWLGMRYPLMFCTDWRQIRLLRAWVVCDLDDPVFSKEELAALGSHRLASIVVTTDSVRRRLQAAGVRAPIEVIPQGIALRAVDRKRVRSIRAEHRLREGEIVAGLHQPRFGFPSDFAAGGMDQMYAVDLLFEAFALARRKEPRLELWLVGEPSASVRLFARDNPWVRLIGYQPRANLADYVSAFDIGLYPRRMDMMGRSSVKVLEYMAYGAPVVGFDVEEARFASDSGAGVVARDVASLGKALAALAGDRARRKRMGEKGKHAALAYSWDLLSEKYRALLDRLAAERNPG